MAARQSGSSVDKWPLHMVMGDRLTHLFLPKLSSRGSVGTDTIDVEAELRGPAFVTCTTALPATACSCGRYAIRGGRIVAHVTQGRLGFPRNSNEANYRDWAIKNPEVVAMFLRFARERMAQGRRFGMKALWERVRWEQPLALHRTDKWRLNNNHVSYVARDLIAIEPRLADYITLRRVKGDQ